MTSLPNLPSVWRSELIHPMTAHFPIALLLLATILRLARMVVKGERARSALDGAYGVNLTVGVVSAWVAVYFGDLAETKVNRELCDPTATHLHGDYAYWASYAFSLALTTRVLAGGRAIMAWIEVLALLGGAALLAYAGHLGASLVYQQAAGVYRPSESCAEFE